MGKDTEKREDQEVGVASVALETMAELATRLVSHKEPNIHCWCDDVKFKSRDDMMKGASPEFVKSFESGHMKLAIDYFHGLIRDQIKKGIKAEKIILAGAGQGAFLAARAALSFPDAKLGGIWMINGFLGAVEVKVDPKQQDLSILFTHGAKDLVIPRDVADSSV